MKIFLLNCKFFFYYFIKLYKLCKKIENQCKILFCLGATSKNINHINNQRCTHYLSSNKKVIFHNNLSKYNNMKEEKKYQMAEKNLKILILLSYSQTKNYLF